MNLSISFIVLSVLPLIPLIVLAFLRNKATKLFSFVFMTLIEAGIIFAIYGFAEMALWEKIVSTIINVIFYAIDLKMIFSSKIEFGNYQILSFWLIYNKLFYNSKLKDKKKLGAVIPYSKATIQYGGRLIHYPEINSKGGTMVTGASGSGKSVQAMELIKQDMDAGRPVVFFDFKGEQSTAEKLKSFAKERNYEIYSLDGEDTFSFDPLYDMSATGRVEAILNTRKWSMDGADAHFRTNTQLLIQKYIQAFDKVFMKSGSKLYTVNFYKFIMANKPDMTNRAVADAYKTLQTLLEVVLTSKLGPSLSGDYPRNFSFKEAASYNEKYIMIISIPSDSKEFANSISSFYFRNIMTTGTNNSFNPGLALYVDEFGTLENPFVVKDILEKGRSCGIMTTIIMQDIFQIVINTNEAYLNSLLGTVNNFVIFAGATREAASKMAGVQIKEVEGILQTLMKPTEDGGSPTACFITKIPVLDKKKSSEVFKYVPYVKGSKVKIGSVLSSGVTEEAAKEALPEDDGFYKDTYDDDMTSDFEAYVKNEPKPLTKAEKKKKDDDDFMSFLDDSGIF